MQETPVWHNQTAKHKKRKQKNPKNLEWNKKKKHIWFWEKYFSDNEIILKIMAEARRQES